MGDYRASRDELVYRVAAELDKPSVYMGGPSKRSMRLAEAVVAITDDHYQGVVVDALRDVETLLIGSRTIDFIGSEPVNPDAALERIRAALREVGDA